MFMFMQNNSLKYYGIAVQPVHPTYRVIWQNRRQKTLKHLKKPSPVPVDNSDITGKGLLVDVYG